MMYKLLKNLCVLFCAVVFISSCRKQAFDDYYGRPDNLQPPIYQVLQEKGNFTNLLALIDKAGYKSTLSAAGYWTMFAPNDAAFQKYFAEKNLTLDRISAADAYKIVTYNLVFNAFQTNHIADYQAPTGWVPNGAYKRRTAYYDGFYKIPKLASQAALPGDSLVVLSSNRNGTPPYLYGDNNNKYIPYFYSSYMSSKGLTATDYNYFFPNSTYTGFNVVNAAVVNTDILAENGVIHEVDQVIAPLPSIEQQLASNSQYSEFKKLFDQFMISYLTNAQATQRYNTLTNKSDNVFIKQYSPLLAFALNNENYIKLTDNDSQTEGYSMFAPTNAALTDYLNTVILEFYKSVDRLPPTIIADFLNAHLWQSTVWPSKFSTTNNFLGEPARFNVNSNIVDKQFCSNGVFYGANQVQKANIFSTVYARAYLDPEYSIMTRLLDLNLRNSITNPTSRFTVFMLSNTAIRNLGYDFNTATSQFTFTANGTTTAGNGPRDQLLRILNLSTVPTPENELNNLGGSGIIETVNGEYIKWNNNTVFSAGNIERNELPAVVGSRDYSDGKVYFLGNNRVLYYPITTIPSHIARYAGTAASPGPYYDFYQYLLSSTLYNATAGDITGLLAGANYTVFIPTRAAMQQAVRDGVLPGIVSGNNVTFTYNPSSVDDKAKVSRFIQFHILDGVAIAADGKKSPNGSAFNTLLVNSSGDKLALLVFNQLNNLQVQDNRTQRATYVPAASNNLATQAILHQINNYLRYNY